MHRHLHVSPAYPPAPRLAVLAAGLLGSVACTGDFEFSRYDDSGGLVDSDTAPEDSLDDTSGWDGMTPGYWVLEANVLVEEGAPAAGDSSVTLRLLDAELESEGPICTVVWSDPSFEVLDVPDPLVYHWWAVDSQGDFGGTCSGAQRRFLPERLLLGLGSLFPDIAAVLEPAGYGDVSGSLYGAYIQTSEQADAPTWAFGVVATAAGYAGQTVPVAAPPVPNGTYRFEPIYLLPLEGG